MSGSLTLPADAPLATVVPTRHDQPTAAAPRGLGLDARTALAGLVVVNVLVLSLARADIAGACGLMVLVGIAGLRRPRLFLGAAGTLAACAGLFLLSALPVHGFLWASLVTIGFWMFRFAVALLAATYVVLTVTPSELTATLHRARAPRALSVPLTVMLRFLPQARQEFRAITEAMSLRGIPMGAASWVRHPLRTIEYLLVPMLVSTSRLADDLTASGLVRGLGGPERPTPLGAGRFGRRDALAATVLLGLVAAAVWTSVTPGGGA